MTATNYLPWAVARLRALLAKRCRGAGGAACDRAAHSPLVAFNKGAMTVARFGCRRSRPASTLFSGGGDDGK